MVLALLSAFATLHLLESASPPFLDLLKNRVWLLSYWLG